jgi:hypothetical protein
MSIKVQTKTLITPFNQRLDRSTPKAKTVSIKKKVIVQPKLERFVMRANVSYTTTYEKTNKNRKTKAHHTSYYAGSERQAIDMTVMTIMATSQSKARKQFQQEITDDIVERDHYKKSGGVDEFEK